MSDTFDHAGDAFYNEDDLDWEEAAFHDFHDMGDVMKRIESNNDKADGDGSQQTELLI